MYRVLRYLAVTAGLVAASLASCNRDDCYRALLHHQSSTESSFCSDYLATKTVQQTPSSIATFGSSRISSACSCLNSPTPSTTAFNPSTCARQSITACPTHYSPCCAFICAEAQVPFKVCSPKNETALAQCEKCPSTGSGGPSTATPTLSSTPTNTTSEPVTIFKPTTLSASTCTGRLLSTTACPTPYDPCCAWNCAEAQVPFNVCSKTDGSGQFAVCTRCPSPTG